VAGPLLLVCFLAYVLWKTLAALCRRASLGDEPRRYFKELAELRLVDVVLPTDQNTEIRRRCITRPPTIRKSCCTTWV